MSLIEQLMVDLRNNYIIFRHVGDDNIIYQAQRNQFVENSGLTIKNPDTEIPAYLLTLSQWGTSLQCGHIIDNIIGYLENAGLSNILLIVDFADITEISESFCEQYTKFLLTTKSKVISINQTTNIINVLSAYIESVIDYQDVL